MRKPGKIDYQHLPPTDRARPLLIARAELLVARQQRQDRFEGRPCPDCGARFLADRWIDQQYCSQPCRSRAGWKKRRRQGTAGVKG